jgi:hypothetical protein
MRLSSRCVWAEGVCEWQGALITHRNMLSVYASVKSIEVETVGGLRTCCPPVVEAGG